MSLVAALIKGREANHTVPHSAPRAFTIFSRAERTERSEIADRGSPEGTARRRRANSHAERARRVRPVGSSNLRFAIGRRSHQPEPQAARIRVVLAIRIPRSSFLVPPSRNPQSAIRNPQSEL